MDILRLKNLVIGFVPKKNRQTLLRQLALPPDQEIHLLSRQEALEVFDPENDEHSLIKGFYRMIQRNLGGGTTEFLRDIKQMTADELLVVFDYRESDALDLDELKNIFQQLNIHQGKYFGRYAIEHLTLDEDHPAEMPLI